jgi:beta-glucosidase
VVSPLDGIIERAGESVQVKYEIGCDIHRSIPLLDSDWVTAAKTNQRGFRLEFFNNLDLAGEPVKVIVTDRMKLAWSDELLDGVDSRCFSARLSGEFSPPETGMFTFSLRGNGIYRMFLDGKLILDQWADKIIDEPPWGSQEYRTSVELKAGNSYQLTIEYAWKGQTHYREIRIGGWPPISDRPIEDAVALSESVDLVIIIAGLTKEWESEGFDRRDMMLPGQQNELIARVAAANPNTVVVLNVGSPVEMPWLNQVGAVLQAWYLGQETGHALADVLFGDVNPSGKLPTTFPRRLQDNPAYINYPGENGKVAYGEGIFVGYRYYDKKEVEPLFPFGFGLSYTKFAYSQLSIERRGKVSNRKILVSAQVQNIGERFGQEVVQLYLKDIESSLVRPPKELKAFAKVNLEPGEIKQVSFSLDRQALCFYDDARKEWVDEPGTFEVNIASSSRHVHLRGQFEWEAGERVDPD